MQHGKVLCKTNSDQKNRDKTFTLCFIAPTVLIWQLQSNILVNIVKLIQRLKRISDNCYSAWFWVSIKTELWSKMRPLFAYCSSRHNSFIQFLARGNFSWENPRYYPFPRYWVPPSVLGAFQFSAMVYLFFTDLADMFTVAILTFLDVRFPYL